MSRIPNTSSYVLSVTGRGAGLQVRAQILNQANISDHRAVYYNTSQHIGIYLERGEYILANNARLVLDPRPTATMATYIYKRYMSPSKNTPPKPSLPKSCRHRHGSEPDSSPCMECKAEKSRATKYRWKIILGLISPYALQALDATM